MSISKRAVPAVLSACFLSACVSAPQEALGKNKHSGAFQKGHASFYTVASSSTRTANGERFRDHGAKTAAHKTLPFGSCVQVEDLNTGRAVAVRINDRGPFVKGRIIDLNLAASNALGMTARGSTPVALKRC